MWLGDTYLDCPTGAWIRALVDAPAADIAKDDFVKITGGQHPRTQGWGETPNDHVAFIQIEDGFALLAIRIFDAFSAAFVVALPTDKVIPSDWKGMFVSINPVTGSVVQSTFIEALAARTKRAKDQCSR